MGGIIEQNLTSRLYLSISIALGVLGLPLSLLAFSNACNTGDFNTGHFAQSACSGCHANGTPLTNFASIQAGPPNMLLPNTVYQIRINAASMTPGRDAFKLQVYNTTTGASLGTLLDGPTGNPLPDVAAPDNCKQGSKIAQTRNLAETFRDYYWRSPAGPNELPARVTISAWFMDGAGNGNGGEPQGIQEFILTNPNASTTPNPNPQPSGGTGSPQGTTSDKTGGGAGFSDLSAGCGLIQTESTISIQTLWLIQLLSLLIIGAHLRAGHRQRDIPD